MTQILIVEDMDALREEIMDTLRFEGFEVLGAENGIIGVTLAEKHLPDLILCDVMMPQMDGYETLRRLRQNSATATIPFIFLTAKAEKSDMRQGMELGADDYLTKPFTVAELLGAIHARLQKTVLLQSYCQQYTSGIDQQTGLPNRVQFYEILTNYLTIANNQSVTLILIDIDQMSLINGTLGREIGDAVLQSVSKRLRSLIPLEYPLARLGSQEFALLIPRLPDLVAVQDLAQHLIQDLSRSYLIYGHEIFITASLGIARYPQDAFTAEDLLKNADIALYYSRQQGSNRYQSFVPEITTQSAERMALENSMRLGLKHDEFRLYFQPILHLPTQKIVGIESLLRWQHRQIGTILPERFLGLAEDTGFIISLDLWVLKVAEQLFSRWHLPISINLSGRHFEQDVLIQALYHAISNYPLCLDISERTIMRHPAKMIAALRTLQEMGVKIAIDDFGTGFSSYEILKQFPANYLKIDGSFIRNITIDKHSAAITLAMIELAHDLNWEVIAEGVETPEQLEFLRREGCEYGQGYLFSPPVFPDQVEALRETFG